MKKTAAIIFAITLSITTLCASLARAAEDSRVLQTPGAAQYPPFANNSNGLFNISVPMVDSLPATVPYPAQWPYITSWPYASGWTYPTWSPYTARWYYSDTSPAYEAWANSDLLSFKDKWSKGDALYAANRWDYPANWPHPSRWSPIDQWPKSDGPPSTADIGTIDILNERSEAIAFGDYTYLLQPGDKVYITRNSRLLGIARIVKLTNSYAMLQAMRVSHDYFLQVGDTFQLMSLAPALDEDHAPRIDKLTEDGRILSNFDFLSRHYKANDFFTVRRNGQNVGTARIMQIGYGYAIFQPSEDTSPQPGDALIYNQAPQTVLSIVHPRTITGASKEGIFVSETTEDRSLQVEKNNSQERKRSLIKKMEKKKDWPDNDAWWEDTYDDQEPWPGQ